MESLTESSSSSKPGFFKHVFNFDSESIGIEKIYVTTSNTFFNEEDAITEVMGAYTPVFNYDLNNDGVINQADLLLLLNEYNMTYINFDISIYDFNSDGIVDVYDLIKTKE